jgi:hypothetical protein
MGEDNAQFFDTVLPGRSQPLGSPGGPSLVGQVGVDTELTEKTPAPADSP